MSGETQTSPHQRKDTHTHRHSTQHSHKYKGAWSVSRQSHTAPRRLSDARTAATPPPPKKTTNKAKQKQTQRKWAQPTAPINKSWGTAIGQTNTGMTKRVQCVLLLNGRPQNKRTKHGQPQSTHFPVAPQSPRMCALCQSTCTWQEARRSTHETSKKNNNDDRDQKATSPPQRSQSKITTVGEDRRRDHGQPSNVSNTAPSTSPSPEKKKSNIHNGHGSTEWRVGRQTLQSRVSPVTKTHGANTHCMA